LKHVQLSRNYGRLGGWLLVEFWTWPNGDPTGIVRSQHIANCDINQEKR
jgi:hypothetical protein